WESENTRHELVLVAHDVPSARALAFDVGKERRLRTPVPPDHVGRISTIQLYPVRMSVEVLDGMQSGSKLFLSNRDVQREGSPVEKRPTGEPFRLLQRPNDRLPQPIDVRSTVVQQPVVEVLFRRIVADSSESKDIDALVRTRNRFASRFRELPVVRSHRRLLTERGRLQR